MSLDPDIHSPLLRLRWVLIHPDWHQGISLKRVRNSGGVGHPPKVFFGCKPGAKTSAGCVRMSGILPVVADPHA